MASYELCLTCGGLTQGQTGFCSFCDSPLMSFLHSPRPQEVSKGIFLGYLSDKSSFHIPIDYFGYHFAFYGVTGSGKTRLAMKLSIEAENSGINLIILDIEGEWKNIIPHFKGKTEYYATDRNLKVNPFDLGDIGAELCNQIWRARRELNPRPKNKNVTVSYERELENGRILENFSRFCRVDLTLSKRAVDSHFKIARAFLNRVEKNPRMISREDVRSYLSWLRENRAPKTYSNHLGTLKRFFRDFLGQPHIVNSFRFPNIVEGAKVIPNKVHLQRFFNALPVYGRFQNVKLQQRYHGFFLLVATSGLRFSEAQSLRKKDFFLEKRMIIPRSHETNSTKKSWVTFYNEECEKYLGWLKNLKDDEGIFPCPRSIRKAFRKACKATGIQITPQVLREWFCQEMGNLGIPDRFVDAFCGRVPKSVLARRYTDYSPEKLREVYEKANLKVLS